MADLSRWPDADALLDEALDLPVERQAAWLEGIAIRDRELAAALALVLRERDDASFLPPGGALSGPLAGALPPTLAPPDDTVAHGRLPIGERFGPYRVTELIGRGGMGEVYRARDIRLERDVALKVLPARWAEDTGRRARFEREARVLASLRHPGIASILHLEEHDGIVALVLELVEGPTLAARLDAGPIDSRTAMAIARPLIDALDAAHQRGIVHRDLKPANIKLPPDGGVKVLDFGLARAFSDEVSGDDAGLTTLDGPLGQVMGTASYMSPEQASGQRVDARTDVWAFGCVLFEMLTGERAFGGATVREIVSKIVEREPDYERLPADTPAPLVRLLRRCLQKDPRKRLGYIGDAHLDLDDAVTGALDSREVAAAGRGWGRRRWLVPVLVVAGLLVAGALAWRATQTAPPRRAMRLAVPLAPGDQFVPSLVSVLAVSPDGSTFVYRVQRQGVTRLHVRSLDSEVARPLVGTENATGPFFSPDGQWIAFDKDGVLTKLSLSGGAAIALCPAPGGLTGAWTDRDTIVFAAGTTRRLQRVSADGGTPENLTTVRTERGEAGHGLPALVPGGRHLLFTIFTSDGAHVASLELATGAITTVIDGRQPSYLRSGHLVFVRQGTLWAAPFDVATQQVTGTPVPAIEAVLESRSAGGGAQYAVSPGGTLLYAPARSTTSARALMWFEDGREPEDLPLEPRSISRIALSPDARRVALAMSESGPQDIWLYEIDRGTLARLTPDAAIDTAPVWAPDGRTLVYRTDQEGGGLFVVSVDGGTPRRLTQTNGPIHTPYAFTPDGRHVVFSEFRSYRDQDVGMVDVETGALAWLLTDAAAELRPALSPDGRWIAYQSDASGTYEVYVRPFPETTGPRVQVSSGGGTSPHWLPDGLAVVFDDGSRLVRVDGRAAGDRFEPTAPRLFVETPGILRDRLGPHYAIAPDGRRVLALSENRRSAAEPSPLMLVEGWLPPVGGS